MINEIQIISLAALAIQNLTLTDIDLKLSVVEHIVMIVSRIIEIILLFKKS